ncbi:MAG: hypothetical protein IT245_04175 [Bacteroidia bacterium]|nr:hypothetical protein [Bacteroidia bacterium]
MINKSIQTLCLLALISIFSCKDEKVTPKNNPVNETELITTLQVILTDSADGSIRRFTFRDSDGEGGNAPTQFDTIKLDNNKTYLCELLYLDESKAIADTISNDIKDEADDHLVYFDILGTNLNVQILDNDNQSLPLGLNSRWRTGNTSTGSIEIVLKHQPGIKTGNKDLGETDAAIKFALEIQ